MSAPTRQQVEDYLLTNPRFAQDWFLENVGQEKLKTWLQRSGDDSPYIEEDFDTEVGYEPTLSSKFKDMVLTGSKTYKSRSRQDRNSLMELSEKELFMELIRDISNELDVDVLCHKILLNVSVLTKSDRGSLFLVRGRHGERYLVSKLFDVTQQSSLEDSLRTNKNEIKVPFGKGIAGTVAETKQPINIKDAYQDPRFNQEVDRQTGYKTTNILCMPILNHEGDLMGVAQIINKVDGSLEFTDSDIEMFRNYLTFCGIGLANAQLFEMSVTEYHRNQMLLRLARTIFHEQHNIDGLVTRILQDAQVVLRCEKCSVFLFEQLNDLGDGSITEEVTINKVYDLSNKQDAQVILTTRSSDIELLQRTEIAKSVAEKGELVVIDTASHPVYNSITDPDGFVVRSLLCLPIVNTEKTPIGVVQLINKSGVRGFSGNDIEKLQAFTIFCGLGIHNCLMYEQASTLMAKQAVALEVLSYHATASPRETNELKNSVISTQEDFRLLDYDFDDLQLGENKVLHATLRIFLDIDVCQRFSVPYKVLCKWILSVRKNYRPVTYHNWRHGFNVTQSMFTMLFRGKMKRWMNDMEVFGMLVACLCHDLDHRGTNNAFQNKVESPLALLYSTSTMEHHHFDQCIMIINSEGCNIFQSLTRTEYCTIIRVIESAILSTDLALYFKKKKEFQELVDSGYSDWSVSEKRDLLRGMMMTACDVAAITKPWHIQEHVAHLVASEFFEQGDLEKTKLKEQPIAMMDRDKKDELPKMQVGFIDAICLPLYQMLSSVQDDLSPLLDGCKQNRACWQELADEISKKHSQQEKDNNRDASMSLTDPKGSASEVDQKNKLISNGGHTDNRKALADGQRSTGQMSSSPSAQTYDNDTGKLEPQNQTQTVDTAPANTQHSIHKQEAGSVQQAHSKQQNKPTTSQQQNEPQHLHKLTVHKHRTERINVDIQQTINLQVTQPQPEHAENKLHSSERHNVEHRITATSDAKRTAKTNKDRDKPSNGRQASVDSSIPKDFSEARSKLRSKTCSIL